MNQTLAIALLVVLIFAVVIAYHYIMDLRTQLRTSRESAATGWKLYETTHHELCVIKGKPSPVPYQPNVPGQEKGAPPPEPVPFMPSGIGPRTINAREERREQQEQTDARPEFANVGTLGVHPQAPNISAAAREAAAESNGKP